jgi:pimeloyl-ACP methyl ester carboxylesterase
MKERSLEYQSKKIFYRVKGEGPAVVLIHGFGEDGKIWKNQYDIFKNCQLIIPDLPGSGRSEMIDDMSMEGLAASVNTILLHEKSSRCTMIGHSMGGYVTLAYAEKYGSDLKSFGLFHSTAFADNEAKIETRKKGIAFIKEHDAQAFLKTTVPNLYGSITKKKHTGLIEDHLKTCKDFTAESLIAYYEAMMSRPDRTEVLKLADVPVLFIFGREDQAVPIEDGLKQCHLPQISHVHILENSGHMGMIEESGAAKTYLNEFLAAIHVKP